MDELRDRYAYRIAVVAIGLALIVVLVGLCVIVALETETIPTELWTTAGALGGGLLGLLAPQPTPSSIDKEPKKETAGAEIWRLVKAVVRDLWTNRSVVILLVVFGVSVGFGASEESSQLQALAAASGAALVGLLAPAPGPTGKKPGGEN